MDLYLIRHVDALDSADDYARRLSPLGHQQIKSLVRFFRANSLLQPEEVWHSPLVRARDTARLMADGLGWKAPLKETDILGPDSDPQAVLRRLNDIDHGVALVGHEPLLSALGTLLAKGSPWPLIFTMRKGDVLALERNGTASSGSWVEKWHMGPELLNPAH